MSLSTPTVTAINYPDATINRAERALCCSPFRVTLFVAMLERSVSLLSIPGAGGLVFFLMLLGVSYQLSVISYQM